MHAFRVASFAWQLLTPALPANGARTWTEGHLFRAGWAPSAAPSAVATAAAAAAGECASSAAAAPEKEPALTGRECYELTGGDAFWIGLACESTVPAPRIAL